MDYIYLVDLNSYLSDDEIKPTDLCRCSLSNRNVLALANDCCVYLLPLEKPNELIPVTFSNSPCLDLAWSNDGLFLLMLQKSGVCNLYNVKTNLLNSIEFVHTFQIKKNDSVCVKPLSKSSKLFFNSDKADSLSYFEKFSFNSSFDCLKNVSYQSFNGFLLLTKTGKFHVLLTDLNSVKNKYQNFDYDMNLKKSLRNSSDNMMDFESTNRSESDQDSEIISFDLGDFTFESDGSITVAFSNFDMASSIYIYRVCIGLSNEINGLINGTNELTNVFNLNDTVGLKSSLLFTSHQTYRCLCIQLNKDTLQFWNRSNDTWNMVNTFQSQSNITRVRMPKLKESFMDEKTYILVSFESGSVGFIDLENFSQDFILPAIPSEQTAGRSTRKKEYLVALDQSYTGSIGIGITNNCTLVAFRQFYMNTTHIDFPLIKLQKSLVNFYEFCMLAGYDYWDLLINTNPKMIDIIIDILEKRYVKQPQSLKKAYFSRFYSLIYSLSRRSTTKSVNQFKSMDILLKLTLCRLNIILSNSVQLSLNVDALINFNNSLNGSLINTSLQPPLINTSMISSNADLFNTTQITTSSNIVHLPLKTNLNEYFSDILNLDKENPAETLNLNEIVQAILSRKNNVVVLNQHVKHLFQWLIDMTLNMIDETITSISQLGDNEYNVSSLLNDYWFLNELRKGIIFIKLISVVNQTNLASQTQSNLISSSLPILAFKSLITNNNFQQQKDVLSELFNILTKMIHRINQIDPVSQETLLEQCLSVQSDMIIKKKFDYKFFNLKTTWFGLSSSSWLKTFHFPVDHLFEAEKAPKQYPLFDIIRLVDFSRSSMTKQCFRCGNFTESCTINSNQSNTISNLSNSIASANSPSNSVSTSSNNANATLRSNNVSMQDLSGDKCICGGFWVLSSLLQ